MTNSLQAKDDQWRDRENASVPVFDPGMSPLGTDEEAGGASPVAKPADDRPRAPMPATPPASNGGLRLPPRVWYAFAAALIALLVVAGWLSFAGSGSR
jgi:hypothetical protein